MDKPTGMVRSVLLALVLAIGAAIVWGIACGFVGSLIETWLRTARQPQSSYEQLLVVQDGTPVIATISSADGYSRSTMRTLNGELRAEGDRLRSASLLAPSQLDRMGQRRDWHLRVQGCSNFATPPSLWYFVHDGRREGQAWFEGFEGVTKQRIGWIGREGFRSDPPGPDETFAVDGRTLPTSLVGHTNPGGPLWGDAAFASTASAGAGRGRVPPWMIYLVSAGRLLEIDLRQRSVRIVLEDAELISAGIVERALGGDEPKAYAEAPVEYLAARGRDCVWIVAPGTDERRKFPLPQELRDRYLGVYLLQDGLLLTASEWPMYQNAPVDVIWLDERGNISRQQVVSLNRARFRSTSGWPNKLGAVVMLPIPVLLGLILVLFQPLEAVFQGTAATYFEALGTNLREYRWFVPPVTLLSFALAAWCCRRHRRFGQSGSIVWFVFVLLLGLPGLAGYLLHRSWPVRQPCPACDQRVPRDRTACRACGAEFPRPAANGTEVFENPPAVQSAVLRTD